MEHYKVTINDNETTVVRDHSFINRHGNIGHMSTKSTCTNMHTDSYSKNIGIVVAIMKTLFFSRRVIGKVVDILLEEHNRYNKKQ